MAIEIRETYYEIYLEGDLFHEGSFKECQEYARQAPDDSCAEVYKITLTEERVVVGLW